METHSNQPSQKNPDHPQEQETLNDQGASGTQARSYECNFCKRSFSNAQALGGHMNMHRKQKATLILHSSNDQSHQQEPLAYFSDMSTREKSFMKWHDHAETNLMITGNYAGEIQQLPLFDDKPPSVADHQETSTSFEAHGSSEKGYSSHGKSSSETLDLELRLGPEPQDSSPPSMGTKKFF